MNAFKRHSLIAGLMMCALLMGIVRFQAVRAGSGSEFVYLPAVLTSGSSTPMPPDPEAQELVDGGTISGVDGVTIGAVSGVLNAPLSVTISQDAALAYNSSPTLTLSGGVTPYGHYYRLYADREVFSAGTATFILGLPVPSGTLTHTLGIALYEPPDGTNSPGWYFLTGLYDVDHNLMLVSLPHIATEARTAVLISHPSLSSPPNQPSLTAVAPIRDPTATGI